MFKKILIANRGVVAQRVARACIELGIPAAAVYSEADADTPVLAACGESVALSGNRPADTYLNGERLIQAARDVGADAIHPGYGFLSENAGFASMVQQAGLTFIGPEPRWLEQMGNKVAARRTFSDAGFPVFAASDAIDTGMVTTADDGAGSGSRRKGGEREAAASAVASAVKEAERIGYPVMIKPAGGGGGIGMQVARNPEELVKGIARAAALARSAFGDHRLYLERWLDRPRHIEYQILADGQGGAVHCFERECSLQRRHQKVIEEAPAPAADDDERDRRDAIAEQARAVCASLGYNNIGTVETLEAGSGESGFLEMNTRLQVEHGVTEAITGLDLVATQIKLAAGQPLPVGITRNGHAMEARVYAEDPRTSVPRTGRLTVFRPPRMHAVRVESGYCEGGVVSPYYDPMLAQVIAWGATREQAIGRLLVGLKGFEIRGVVTNVPMLVELLQDTAFLRGQIHTGFLTDFLARLRAGG